MSPDIKTVEDIENSILDDYQLVDYEPDSFIKFPIAV
jgi:thymidylate synthase